MVSRPPLHNMNQRTPLIDDHIVANSRTRLDIDKWLVYL